MKSAGFIRLNLPLLSFLLTIILGNFGGNILVVAVTQEEIDQKTTLECTTQGFVVYMESDLVLEGVGAGESIILYVGNESLCNYTGNAGSGIGSEKIYRTTDGTQYVFNFTYPDCDSSRNYVMDYLNYKAVIGRDSYYIPGVSPLITRIAHLEVNLDCVYYLNGTTVSTSFQVMDEPIIDNLTGEGILSLRAELYKYLDYEVKYTFPVYVNQGKLLYIQVSERNPVQDDAYELIIENCTLSNKPNMNDPNARTEDIVIETCATDANLYNYIDPPSPEIARFYMPAVGFFEDPDVPATWLTCTVIVCEFNSPTSECNRERNCTDTGGTTNRRVKREFNDQFGNYYEYKTREQIVLGQIILLEPDEGETTVVDPYPSESQTNIIIGAAGAAATGTVFTAGDGLGDCPE